MNKTKYYVEFKLGKKWEFYEGSEGMNLNQCRLQINYQLKHNPKEKRSEYRIIRVVKSVVK